MTKHICVAMIVLAAASFCFGASIVFLSASLGIVDSPPISNLTIAFLWLTATCVLVRELFRNIFAADEIVRKEHEQERARWTGN